jgi:UDP-N-acetylmuramoylalanine--D-glutamate ligase
VKTLLLNGATAAAIRQAVENCPGEKPQIFTFEALDEAITAAAEMAEAGDVVLLSPASASFDQFKNFEIRGDHFRRRIMEL